MSLTIVIVIFTILTGDCGFALGESLLGIRAVADNFLFPCAGRSRLRGLRRKPFRERDCRVVWRDGTAIRLFASALRPTKRARAGCYVLQFEARTTGRPTSTPRRSGSGRPGDLFRRAATYTDTASVCAGRLSSKQVRQTIFKSRLRDQLLRYHRSLSVRLSIFSIVQASPRSPLTSAHPLILCPVSNGVASQYSILRSDS